MKTFNDLKFNLRFDVQTAEKFPIVSNAKHAFLEFENGYGISVICGYGAYGSSDYPYECAVLKNGSLCYDTHITNNVIGHCNENKVTEIMIEIQKL